MESIIKSLFTKTDTDYSQYLGLLLDPEKKVLISPQEEQALLFLRESFEIQGQLPTEEYFLSKFDHYSVPMKNVQPLNVTDLKVPLLQPYQ